VNDRDAFLVALRDQEDDITTRMVYADWLDDHGEHEEADRQRKWPAAKEWLVEFAKQFSDEWDEDVYLTPVTYEKLIELGHKGLSQGHVICGNNDSLWYALEQNSKDFWMKWSIVTGVVVPDDTAGQMSYSCAC
jgi:uncharacterized protein (TIGR02996 family)